MTSMKKIGVISKQYPQNKMFKQMVVGQKGYSLLNFKAQKEKENKAVAKRKAVTKSTEKIGPKIISKYSVSKYHSNFDDMNFDDGMDEVHPFEETYKFDGEELAKTLRMNGTQKIDLNSSGGVSIPRKINREQELENDKLHNYSSVRVKDPLKHCVSPQT